MTLDFSGHCLCGSDIPIYPHIKKGVSGGIVNQDLGRNNLP